jgi:hypothetical protein
MTVSVGDILRVVATIAWDDGNIMQNVFNAEIVGTGGPFADEDIVDDAVAWVVNMWVNIAGNVSDQANSSQVQVYKYDVVGDDWDEVGTGVWTQAFSQSLDQIPRGAAALLTARTTDPDVLGKKYIGGLCENSFDDGLVNVARLVELLALAADWITDFTGGTSGADWDPGVWSVAGKVLLGFVDQIVASAIPAYQRRRKRGVGV